MAGYGQPRGDDNLIVAPFTHPLGRAALAAALAVVVVSACGAPSTSEPGTAAPTTSNGAPTTTTTTTTTTSDPTAAVATAAPVPTAVARPTQTASAALSSPASAVRLVLDPSASQASYHAHEQLVGKTLPSEAVGTSPGVSGSLVLQADGAIAAEQSTITVDLTKLKSDESRRDNFIQRDTLQTSQFPTATFVAQSVTGLPTPLPTSGQATFQLLGDLTVHGVTRPVTWQVTAQFADASVSGSATTSVNITDFGMTPPRAGPVLSIEDALNLELAFTAARAA
jgi:polyisoprenoid-binding protein YceI